MTFYAQAALLNALSSAVLGVLVLVKGNKSRLAQSFFWYSLSVVVWSIPYFLWQISTNEHSSLSMTKALMYGAIVIPATYSNFVHEITGIRKNKILTVILYLSTLGLLILNSVNLLVSHVSPILGFTYWPVAGNYYWLFLLFWLTVVLYSIYMLILGVLKSKEAKRNQLILVLIGTIIGYGGGATNYPLWYGVPILPWGNIGATVYSLFVAYTILTAQLFDIKVAIRRTIVYSLLLFTLFGVYSLIILLFANLLPFTASGNAGRYTNFLVALIIGFSFNPFKAWLQDRTDKFLYKKEYEQQSVLHDLSNQLNNVIGLDEALEIVMQTILKTFRISKAVTYIFQNSEHGSIGVKRIKHIGFTKETSLMLSERDFIIEYFSASAQIVTLRNLKEHFTLEAIKIHKEQAFKKGTLKVEDLSLRIRANAKLDVVIRKLTSLGAEAVVPLHLGEQFIGLLLLSNKLSEDPFTNNDLQLLDLAGQAAISSIQKAKLYEGDQMKSEFVSIASHELLTPISAIEGYLSMILDENIGTVDEQARGYLTKVYTSSRRLSQLVKDLLSVSRIESGRMSITPQAVDMGKLIKETMEQLHFLAKNKGLEFNYTVPAKALPMVRADPDRVTQVLTNLLSNAIKYTPSGSVTIKTSVTKTGDVRLAVSDTGMGMTRQSRSHLFEKFYRIATDETVGIIGTGLGLYITRSILEKMGGSISVESVPKRGSTFTITLPSFEPEAVVQYN